MIPVLSVVGYSNSGKTTLVEKLVRELKNRGYRVAVIKHHHGDFEIDKPGKDTWRHAEAGADVVVMAAPRKIAVIEKLTAERALDEVIGAVKNVDLIITEGYKKENKPKIEVFRSAVHRQIITPVSELLAIASDVPLHYGVPCLDIDNPGPIVDLIEDKLLHKSLPPHIH
ncbi:MAG: molybdopterin-guanine dinucleotide biosynthesis protein B [Bacillota bacterium]